MLTRISCLMPACESRQDFSGPRGFELTSEDVQNGLYSLNWRSIESADDRVWVCPNHDIRFQDRKTGEDRTI